MAEKDPLHFLVVLFDGVDELDALAPFEVLANAKRFGAPWSVRLAHLEGPREVRGAHGTRFHAECSLTEPAQWVLVPGGGWADNAPEGARAEVRKGALTERLRALHEEGVGLASVCTGAMLLGAAGLLRGRAATTHYSARQELEALGAQVVEARVVDDGDFVTAGGVTSGLDLGLWLLERLGSAALSKKVAQRLEYQRQGVVFRGPMHFARAL